MVNNNANTNLLTAIILIPITIACMLLFVYAFAPAIGAVLDLWNTIPADNTFYSESLHNNVIFAFTSWHTYVIIVAVISFVYLAVNVYKRQRYQERGNFEEYYER